MKRHLSITEGPIDFIVENFHLFDDFLILYSRVEGVRLRHF
jgi:hypothetical protein